MDMLRGYFYLVVSLFFIAGCQEQKPGSPSNYESIESKIIA